MQKEHDQIGETQTHLKTIQTSMQSLLDDTVSLNCDEDMKVLAQLSNARSVGALLLHHGNVLMQLGADLSFQLSHVFVTAMKFFKEKYNTLATRGAQKSFYLMFDESGFIPEEKRTVELPRFLGEPEK